MTLTGTYALPILVMLVVTAPCVSAHRWMTLGILAQSNKTADVLGSVKRWQDTFVSVFSGVALTSSGARVLTEFEIYIEPMSLSDLDSRVRSARVDLVLTEGSHAAKLQYQIGARPLAMLEIYAAGYSVVGMGAAVFTKNSKRFPSLVECGSSSARIAAADTTNFACFGSVLAALRDAGKSSDDLQVLRVTRTASDEASLLLVDSDAADCAFVCTGSYELASLTRPLSQLVLLQSGQSVDPYYPLMATTVPVPAWVLLVTPNSRLRTEDVSVLATSLSRIKSTSNESIVGGYVKFTAPISLDAVLHAVLAVDGVAFADTGDQLQQSAVAAIAVVVIVFVAAAVFFWGYRVQVRWAKFHDAPKANSELFVAFIVIKNATLMEEYLEGSYSRVMQAVEKIIRSECREHRCYFVRRLGSGFWLVGQTATLVECTRSSVAKIESFDWSELIDFIGIDVALQQLSSSSNRSGTFQLNSLRSRRKSHHSTYAHAKRAATHVTAAAGVAHGQCNAEFDPDEQYFFYSGPAVQQAALIADATSDRDILMTLEAAEHSGRSVDRSSTLHSHHRELTVVHADDVHLSKEAFGTTDTRDSIVDTVADTLEIFFCGLTARDVTVVCITFSDVALVARNATPTEFAGYYENRLRQTREACLKHRVEIVSFLSGTIMMTINAVLRATDPHERALCIIHALVDIWDSRYTSAFASGNCVIGCCEETRCVEALIGDAVGQCAALDELCGCYAGITTLTTLEHWTEIKQVATVEIVDIVHALPGASGTRYSVLMSVNGDENSAAADIVTPQTPWFVAGKAPPRGWRSSNQLFQLLLEDNNESFKKVSRVVNEKAPAEADGIGWQTLREIVKHASLEAYVNSNSVERRHKAGISTRLPSESAGSSPK